VTRALPDAAADAAAQARRQRAEALTDDGIAAAETNGELFTAITLRSVPYGEWANIGLYLEAIAPGCFAASIAAQPAVPLLLWHDNKSFPVGVAEAFDDNSRGLDIRFRIPCTAAAQEAARVSRDLGMGASVGFVPERSSWTYVDDWDPMRGVDHIDRVTRTQARLAEVSLTPTPAYPSARVLSVQAEALRDDVDTQARMWRAWVREARRHYTT
jgi:hypothetical protein